MANLDGIGQLGHVDIVGAPDEDDMDTAHAGQERNDAPGHDLVLAEEALISNVAARQAKGDDDNGGDGAPPAVEKGRVVGDPGAAVGRRDVEEGARDDHAGGSGGSPLQTRASAEGELAGEGVLKRHCLGMVWMDLRCQGALTMSLRVHCVVTVVRFSG